MAFEQHVNITKVGIEDFEIRLFVPGPSNIDGIQAGIISFQILMSDDSIEPAESDLIARLGDDAAGLVHLSNLADLRDYIRTRLNDEALPTP